ncbi:DDE-type integrase/transposase/recombinase, partial [Streptomyces sp. NPDC017991]|uniref:DDE-type integrase/transposase/recombinase n=1 Tax=Streptomyces sp. NPDC017991 TaxID=3365026 RepID=UPI0037B49761
MPRGVSRRLAGWAAADHMRADVVIDALHAAERTRGSLAGTVFHSDHGASTAVGSSTDACREAGVTQSMSAIGSSADNALAESLHATCKRKTLQGRRVWDTEHEVHLDSSAGCIATTQSDATPASATAAQPPMSEHSKHHCLRGRSRTARVQDQGSGPQRDLHRPGGPAAVAGRQLHRLRSRKDRSGMFGRIQRTSPPSLRADGEQLPSPSGQLRAASADAQANDSLMREAVIAERMRGTRWEVIAEVVGVTAEEAERRWGDAEERWRRETPVTKRSPEGPGALRGGSRPVHPHGRDEPLRHWHRSAVVSFAGRPHCPRRTTRPPDIGTSPNYPDHAAAYGSFQQEGQAAAVGRAAGDEVRPRGTGLAEAVCRATRPDPARGGRRCARRPA